MKLLPILATILTAGMVLAEQEPAAAPKDQSTDLMTMTQDARCKQVIVTCLINGQPMRMMLDTGATHTVLHEESAAELKNARWIDTSKMLFRGNSSQRPKLLIAPLQVGPAESPEHPIMV
ncbi:MAG: retroviral-like aspartic protease family protein, partial [Akkermansia sp.]|nr:retroviral-like aspartic protease family protein [Akkermansia sp.]